MRSIIPFQRNPDREWVGGRYVLPHEIREGDMLLKPEAVLWLELPRGVIVGLKINDSSEPASFAQSLEDAMKNPGEGSPRKPSRIRVSDRHLAEELRGTNGLDVPVVVAPVPELDEAFADLERAMTEALPPASYLDGGKIPPEILGGFFSAASILFKMAPWQRMFDSEILRVDIPRLDIEGACLSVIGAAGESFGILLFRSLESFEAFAIGATPLISDAAFRAPRGSGEPAMRSLSFDRKRDLPPSMLREIKTHRWPLAGAKAYPTLLVLADWGAVAATERDYRIMTACAAAFSAFFARHGQLFEDGTGEEVCESFTGEDEITVTLTVPYGTDYLPALRTPLVTAEDLFLRDEPLVKAAGRNDPCPCGSGKKYKKCHLDSGRAANEISPQIPPVHQMDNNLMEGIVLFAASRFGSSWLDSATKGFENDEASLQILIPWTAWTAVSKGKRVADSFLEEYGTRLSSEERAWFAAQKNAWLSLWEVTRVEAGTLEVRDLLSGERRSVRDSLASRTLVERDTLLARVVDFRGDSVFVGMHGRALSPLLAMEVIRLVRTKLRNKKGDIAVERLRDPKLGRFMIELWVELVEELDRRASLPPKLENTDGDPLLLVTETFPFDTEARSEIERRLSEMDGFLEKHTGEDESELVVVRLDDPAQDSGESTLIGRVIVARDSLRIETNSEKRASSLGRRVRDACGRMLRESERTTQNAGDIARGVPADVKPRDQILPEEDAAVIRELKDKHYRQWIDMPIQALGGKTPRAASRAAKSREKLDVLLREMENQEVRSPEGERFSFGGLRRELGLDP